MQRAVLRVTPFAVASVARLVPSLIDALEILGGESFSEGAR
jgi:hypothetical protein